MCHLRCQCWQFLQAHYMGKWTETPRCNTNSWQYWNEPCLYCFHDRIVWMSTMQNKPVTLLRERTAYIAEIPDGPKSTAQTNRWQCWKRLLCVAYMNDWIEQVETRNRHATIFDTYCPCCLFGWMEWNSMLQGSQVIVILSIAYIAYMTGWTETPWSGQTGGNV